FNKVARSDLFVILDHVQYGAESFQNRNRIKLSTGAHWITVPVQRHGLGERICDKATETGSGARDWQKNLWRTVAQSYAGSPHFRDYRDPLHDAFTRPWEKLVDLNVHLLKLVLGWLGIRTPAIRSSTLGLQKAKTELIGEMCDLFGAGTYLSGVGGSKGYLDV